MSCHDDDDDDDDDDEDEDEDEDEDDEDEAGYVDKGRLIFPCFMFGPGNTPLVVAMKILQGVVQPLSENYSAGELRLHHRPVVVVVVVVVVAVVVVVVVVVVAAVVVVAGGGGGGGDVIGLVPPRW